MKLKKIVIILLAVIFTLLIISLGAIFAVTLYHV
jgi:flagellar basal body-associated protein FliL